MLNSDVLEVATGLVFIYLVLSLATTSLRESLEAFLKHRGQTLEKGVVELLGAREANADLLAQFYRHPLIFGLFRGDYAPPELPDGASEADRRDHRRIRRKTARMLPSYIPAESFARAVIDMASAPPSAATPMSVARLAACIQVFPDGQLKSVLRIAVQSSGGDMAKVQAFLQDWFNAGMDRVSGAYRRATQIILFVFSLLACVVLNVNTVVITEALSQNLTLREAIVQRAQAAARQEPKAADTAIAAQIGDIKSTGLPIGWSPDVEARMAAHLKPPPLPGSPFPTPAAGSGLRSLGYSAFGVLELAAGWVVTAVAITLGAPFWFDVLNKIMIVRATVKPAEKSGDEASKDPAAKKSPLPAPAAALAAPSGAPAAPAGPPPTPIVDPRDQEEIRAIDPYERPREDA